MTPHDKWGWPQLQLSLENAVVQLFATDTIHEDDISRYATSGYKSTDRQLHGNVLRVFGIFWDPCYILVPKPLSIPSPTKHSTAQPRRLLNQSTMRPRSSKERSSLLVTFDVISFVLVLPSERYLVYIPMYALCNIPQ